MKKLNQKLVLLCALFCCATKVMAVVNAEYLTIINTSNKNITAYSIANDGYKFKCLSQVPNEINGIPSPSFITKKVDLGDEVIKVQTFKIAKHSKIQFAVSPQCTNASGIYELFGMADEQITEESSQAIAVISELTYNSAGNVDLFKTNYMIANGITKSYYKKSGMGAKSMEYDGITITIMNK